MVAIFFWKGLIGHKVTKGNKVVFTLESEFSFSELPNIFLHLKLCRISGTTRPTSNVFKNTTLVLVTYSFT